MLKGCQQSLEQPKIVCHQYLASPILDHHQCLLVTITPVHHQTPFWHSPLQLAVTGTPGSHQCIRQSPIGLSITKMVT